MKADLHGANFTNANLSSAHLHGSNLQGANLRGANLCWAGLIGSNLQGADLTGADLTKAKLMRPDRCVPAGFRRWLTPELGYLPPNLAQADLTGAILVGADLIDADLTGATLSGVRADARTRWPEGFDPQQHGVETLPMATEWRLKRGVVALGTLQDCRPDYRPLLPCFRCHFTSTSAFKEVQPLFDEAVRLQDAERREGYFKACEAIDALGLQLESPEGEVLKPYSLYIEDKEARFRY
jgi:hypothetical protein